MSLWRQVSHGLRSILRRKATDREIQEEVGQYLDEAMDELMAVGASRDEAMRAVRLKYGSAHAAHEEVRSSGWEHTVLTTLSDIRFGIRLLRRNPGFTTVAVLTLGLGIGSATAIFSAVSPVLFEPLPYPRADRIHTITDRSPDGEPLAVTFGTYRELLDRTHSFEVLSVFRPWRPTMTGQGEPERLEAQRVSASYFRVLGVQPALGLGFDEPDDRRGGPDVVVLSDGLWRRRFGGDSTVVGQLVRLGGRSFRVAGVMPHDFENVPPHPAEAWSLLQYDASPPSFETREWGHHLNLVARLKAGVDPDVARAELDRIAANPMAERPRPSWAAMGQGLLLRSLKETATAGARPALLALLGAVGLLLVIACVNVTNLLLARSTRRSSELTMRTVLGAARSRLLRQLVTEGLLLAALGGVLGIAVALVGIDALIALSPPDLPRVSDITINGAAFAFALGVTTLIGIVVGMVPLLGPMRRALHAGVLAASRRVSGSHIATRRVLVVAEVGLAFVLMVGAGLLVRSTLRLSRMPTGFDASGIVVMQVQTAGEWFATDDAVHRFFAQSLSAVRQLPGVASAALTSQLPLSGDLDTYGVTLEHDKRPDAERAAHRYTVSPGYFETMRIPIISGRSFASIDAVGAPREVVISETFANTFAGGDPIGQRVHVGRTDLPWYTIVGVVGDVRQVSLETGPTNAVYVQPTDWYFADEALWMVVRAERDPAALVPSIKRAIWSVDSDQPIVRIATMEDVVVRSDAQRRFALIILESFALLALVLAVIGLYGIVSGSVNERLHEIGIRAALGATRERIVQMVIRQGMVVTAVGIAIGLVGSAVASETVVTLLFGVSRLDPTTYIGVALLLIVVSALACWVPAARAAGVDPARTLRAD